MALGDGGPRDGRVGDGQPRARPTLTRVACSRTESAAISAMASSARARAAGVASARQRRDHLLDEPDLAVGGGLERPQVAGLEAEVGQLAGGPGDHQGVAVEVSGAGVARTRP